MEQDRKNGRDGLSGWLIPIWSTRAPPLRLGRSYRNSCAHIYSAAHMVALNADSRSPMLTGMNGGRQNRALSGLVLMRCCLATLTPHTPRPCAGGLIPAPKRTHAHTHLQVHVRTGMRTGSYTRAHTQILMHRCVPSHAQTRAHHGVQCNGPQTAQRALSPEIEARPQGRGACSVARSIRLEQGAPRPSRERDPPHYPPGSMLPPSRASPLTLRARAR
jgi:hypothetical protein